MGLYKSFPVINQVAESELILNRGRISSQSGEGGKNMAKSPKKSTSLKRI
jgi:hypothetical protein